MKSLKGKFCACGRPAEAWVPTGDGETERAVCHLCLEAVVFIMEDEEDDDLSLIGEGELYID